MEFYLIFVLVSVLFFHIAVKTENRLLLVFSMLLPILLEGLRYKYVGTDMSVYGDVFFRDSRFYKGFFDIIKKAPTQEYLYYLLNYICIKITPNINFFLTVCAAIKVFLVYSTAYRQRNEISPTFFIATYFLFFYFSGFSMMRQSLAIALSIYSLNYYFSDRKLPFLLTNVCAYFFHNSAVLMILLILLYYMRNMKYRLPVNIVMAMLLLLAIRSIMVLFLGGGLFSAEKVEHYMDSGVNTAKTNILLTVSCLLYALYLKLKDFDIDDFLLYVYIACGFYTLSFLFLAGFVEIAFRLSYYPFIASLLILSYLLRKTSKEDKNIILFYSLFGGLFLLHFIVLCSHGLSGTIPYSSKIIGF